MPSRADATRRYLEDIRHHIALAQEFVSGTDYSSFSGDTLRLYAVTRCLEIISEASRRLSNEVKARHPAIAWREMAAAGNIYRHEYEDVVARRVWRTLTISLPQLAEAIADELAMIDDQQ